MPFNTYFSNTVGSPITDSSVDLLNFSVGYSIHIGQSGTQTGDVKFFLLDANGNQPSVSSFVSMQFPTFYGVTTATSMTTTSLLVNLTWGLYSAGFYLYALNNNGVLDLMITADASFGDSINPYDGITTIPVTPALEITATGGFVGGTVILGQAQGRFFSNAGYTSPACRLIARFHPTNSGSGGISLGFDLQNLYPTRTFFAPINPNGLGDNILRDLKTQNVAGGAATLFSSAGYQTRVFFDSASTTTIVLTPGLYRVLAFTTIKGCDETVFALKDAAGTTNIEAYGINSQSSSGNTNMETAIIETILNLTSEKVMSMGTAVTTTAATNGFGAAMNFAGEGEYYTELMIERLRSYQ